MRGNSPLTPMWDIFLHNKPEPEPDFGMVQSVSYKRTQKINGKSESGSGLSEAGYSKSLSVYG